MTKHEFKKVVQRHETKLRYLLFLGVSTLIIYAFDIEYTPIFAGLFLYGLTFKK